VRKPHSDIQLKEHRQPGNARSDPSQSSNSTQARIPKTTELGDHEAERGSATTKGTFRSVFCFSEYDGTIWYRYTMVIRWWG
jgi:hypothetical protein